jgi:hypothetical protein
MTSGKPAINATADEFAVPFLIYEALIRCRLPSDAPAALDREISVTVFVI